RVRVLMHDQRERLVEVDCGYAYLIDRAARCVRGEVEPDLVRPRARAGMLVLVVAEVVETVPVMDVDGIGAAGGEPFRGDAEDGLAARRVLDLRAADDATVRDHSGVSGRVRSQLGSSDAGTGSGSCRCDQRCGQADCCERSEYGQSHLWFPSVVGYAVDGTA